MSFAALPTGDCGQRNYQSGSDREIGSEATPELWVRNLVEVFRGVKRVLRDDGTLWLDVGDKYAGSWGAMSHDLEGKAQRMGSNDRPASSYPLEGYKPKALIGLPWMLAFALRADGWYLRSEIIWHKVSPMPQSVQGSQWVRHRITIQQYERLSALRRPHSNLEDRAGNLSPVSEGAAADQIAPAQGNTGVPSLAASLRPSAGRSRAQSDREDQVQSYAEIPRDTPSLLTTAEGKGERATTRTISAGEGRSETLLANGQGTRIGSTPLASSQGDTESQRVRSAPPSTYEESANQEVTEAAGNQEKQAQTTGIIERERSDNNGLASDSQGAQGEMPLLPEAHSFDDGSRNSVEQGWPSQSREHRASLPIVQLEEEQPLDSTLVECPGCKECADHDGFVLRWNAGRPTTAHEQLFLLSKQPRYFYDAEAVREELEWPEELTRATPAVFGGRNKHAGYGNRAMSGREYKARGWAGSRFDDGKTSETHPNVGKNERPEPPGRNARSVQAFAPSPFSVSRLGKYSKLPGGAAGHGTERITSSDCPVHGGLPVASRSHDERSSSRPLRSSDTVVHPAQGQLIAPDSMPPLSSADAESLGFGRPEHSDVATARNSASNKTAHDASTSPSYTASGETPPDTERTSEPLAQPAARHPDTSGSNTSADSEQYDLAGRTPDDNSGTETSECSCEYTVSHFAVYPISLPTWCIKAGTSEKGVCATCGAPWVRQTETAQEFLSEQPGGQKRGDGARNPGNRTDVPTQRTRRVDTTLGWLPTCEHPGNPVPATVLDPFMGAGTTALAAARLGRNSIGIELRSDYIRLAEARLKDDAPMLVTKGGP